MMMISEVQPFARRQGCDDSNNNNDDNNNKNKKNNLKPASRLRLGNKALCKIA